MKKDHRRLYANSTLGPRLWSFLIAVGIVGMLAIWSVFVVGPARPVVERAATVAVSSVEPGSPDDVAALRAAFIAARQTAASADYRVSAVDSAAVRAENVRQGVRIEFGPDALVATSSERTSEPWSLEMTPSRIGRVNEHASTWAKLAERGEAKIEGNRVSYQRGSSVEEWYVNGPLGVEQGFTLQESPLAGSGELVIEQSVSGMKPTLRAGDVVFQDSRGRDVARYSELFVKDARGARVPARLVVLGRNVQIVVEDSRATYPLVVDPILAVLDSQLFPTDGLDSHFGDSVSISVDVAVVGARWNSTAADIAGSVYVFERQNAGWVQSQQLFASDAQEGDRFGSSVSVSTGTIFVGAPSVDIEVEGGEEAFQVGATYVFARENGTWMEQQKLVRAAPASGDRFGNVVSVWGELAVVSAPYADVDRVADAGAVYVYRYDGDEWTLEATLTGPESDSPARLGASVALCGSTVVAGAPDLEDEDGLRGRAFVFQRRDDGWSAGLALEPSERALTERFGMAVAVHDDTIVVGSPDHNVMDENERGSAYIFARSGEAWVEEAKFDSPTAHHLDDFGASVAVHGRTVAVGEFPVGEEIGVVYVYVRGDDQWSLQESILDETNGESGFPSSLALWGDTLLIGMDNYDGPGVDSGGVALHTRTDGAWEEEETLVPLSARNWQSFGESLTIDGDRAAIGALAQDGAVYVFDRGDSGWLQGAQITVDDAGSDPAFGSSVALDGDTLIVGAFNGTGGQLHGGPVLNAGAAYVYLREPGGSWLLQGVLTARDAASMDRFGRSVSVQGDVAVVGASRVSIGEDLESTFAGAVYVFRRSEGVWTHEAKLFPDERSGLLSFGYSVSLDNSRILIGAPGARVQTEAGEVLGQVGRAYVFQGDCGLWYQQAILFPDPSVVYDRFGFAVSLHGDRALVGVPGGVPPDPDGTAYVFRSSSSFWETFQRTSVSLSSLGCSEAVRGIGGFSDVTWSQEAQLMPDPAYRPVWGSFFGVQVDLGEDMAIVGAPVEELDPGSGTVNNGGAYLFARRGETWSDPLRLASELQMNQQVFGIAVGLGDGIAMVGAEGEEVAGKRGSGSVYLYEINPCVPVAENDATCDGIDDDCDDVLDEDYVPVSTACEGVGLCGQAVLDSCVDGETAHTCQVAAATDDDCDGVDDDCNGVVDNVTVETCDGEDNDCDGDIDDADDSLDTDSATTWYSDGDDDGYGIAGVSVTACVSPEGFAEESGDCNDADEDIHPGASEVCDEGVDNDCDGDADDGDESLDLVTRTKWFADSDEDGFGDISVSTHACAMPDGFSADFSDCDDTDAAINPDAVEICDDVDNDCDELVDDDDDPPADVATWYRDSDADTYGAPATTKAACEQPDGYVARAGDCDDRDDRYHPEASEECDGYDNDCDDLIDDDDDSLDLSTAQTYYRDTDRDAFGDASGSPDSTRRACHLDADGWAYSDDDCDDDDANVYPGAPEFCNGIDNDCDGVVDENACSALDTDLDGLTNDQEIALGSDPNNPDDDGDGVPTNREAKAGDLSSAYFFGAALVIPSNLLDTDNDGIWDFMDTDDDGDGVPTSQEIAALGSFEVDTDNDGIPDIRDQDDDGDSIPTLEEVGRVGGASVDTDGNGVPDYLDDDDDGDGIPTVTEVRHAGGAETDTDSDGIPDILDSDSDGDGTVDGEEGTGDSDGDGVPDYLDDECDPCAESVVPTPPSAPPTTPSSEAAATPTSTSGCSVSGGGTSSPAGIPLALLLAGALAGGVMRRKSSRSRG